jgi:hypothetical protein
MNSVAIVYFKNFSAIPLAREKGIGGAEFILRLSGSDYY